MDSTTEGAKTPGSARDRRSAPQWPSPKSKRRTAAATAPGQPPRLQVAALCWRRSGKGVRILLITSRDTGRWVIPKGWPMRNRTEAEAAAREAYEEAGLRGVVSARSIGIYTYRKALAQAAASPASCGSTRSRRARCCASIPETGQRRAKWFSPAKAARRVAEHELAAIDPRLRSRRRPSGSGRSATRLRPRRHEADGQFELDAAEVRAVRGNRLKRRAFPYRAGVKSCVRDIEMRLANFVGV